ncbi:MAG TPA: hypothetical protein VLG50_08070 [Candidatus Saccharimonadales bacterium]|nr:hypothetical protein [Candidatus Saccharimonadales bacterium]
MLDFDAIKTEVFYPIIKSDKTLAIPYGDGLVEDEPQNNAYDYNKYHEDILLAVHCYRNVKTVKNRLICLPLDDDIFEYGLPIYT